MSEWKGPWKCEKCGEVLSCPETPHMWKGGPYGYCKGAVKPYDRRAPDPDLLALLRKAWELLTYRHDEEERQDLLGRIYAALKEAGE